MKSEKPNTILVGRTIVAHSPPTLGVPCKKISRSAAMMDDDSLPAMFSGADRSSNTSTYAPAKSYTWQAELAMVWQAYRKAHQ